MYDVDSIKQVSFLFNNETGIYTALFCLQRGMVLVQEVEDEAPPLEDVPILKSSKGLSTSANDLDSVSLHKYVVYTSLPDLLTALYDITSLCTPTCA
jgi:hypothetical protein